ncbi:MAG: cytochrome o ubiquinol oxidase subunit 3 [Rickettsiales bacterium]|jgi:cytochrome o ubiquinol oxidase subunit 3
MSKNKVDTNQEEHHHESNNIFGFWVYLMSDCVLFATLFATYAVLAPNVFGGPSGRELFNLEFVLVETFILLFSSFSCGLAIIASYKKSVKETIFWFFITFLLGASFIAMEIYEFLHLIHQGHTPGSNAFLSIFFTLVGTHGFHVTAGLVWLVILMIQIKKYGFTDMTRSKIICFGLFWHFLDLIWIFVFTIVYLMGAV